MQDTLQQWAALVGGGTDSDTPQAKATAQRDTYPDGTEAAPDSAHAHTLAKAKAQPDLPVGQAVLANARTDPGKTLSLGATAVQKLSLRQPTDAKAATGSQSARRTAAPNDQMHLPDAAMLLRDFSAADAAGAVQQAPAVALTPVLNKPGPTVEAQLSSPSSSESAEHSPDLPDTAFGAFASAAGPADITPESSFRHGSADNAASVPARFAAGVPEASLVQTPAASTAVEQADPVAVAATSTGVVSSPPSGPTQLQALLHGYGTPETSPTPACTTLATSSDPPGSAAVPAPRQITDPALTAEVVEVPGSGHSCKLDPDTEMDNSSAEPEPPGIEHFASAPPSGTEPELSVTADGLLPVGAVAAWAETLTTQQALDRIEPSAAMAATTSGTDKAQQMYTS